MVNQADGGGASAPAPRLTGHPTQRRRPVPKPKPRLTGHPSQRRRVVPKSSSRSTTSTSSRGSSSNRRSYRVRPRSTSYKSTSRSTPRNPPSPTAARIRPVAPPKPVIPDVNKFLTGDTTYQRQLAAYAKALSDFQANQTLSRSDYNTNYQNTYRDIGLSKADAAKDLENDFAARGLLKSSMYTQGVGDLNQEYQNQYNDLASQRTNFLKGLTNDYTAYQNEQGTQKQNARAEALRRRAEKYNL